ncbi:MAG: fused MFS/spermidine synthase [Planctomycetales bacterium]|nr:fused MFS/spermidine synthase [Planctomycetales bacterium]
MNQRPSVVAALLFVSGMCALIFQTAWLREFGLVFGASTPATAAVLAIFMGGLGLGNIILGKRADNMLNPFRYYGWLELGISLSAFVSPLLTILVRSLYLGIGGQETLGIWGATFARLIFSAVVLGVPTFLMGGTLPAAARAIMSEHDPGRRNVGLLYGFNTLGAVVGTLLATFLLLERWGIRSTLWAACGCNFGVALVAIGLSAGCEVLNKPKTSSRAETEAFPKPDPTKLESAISVQPALPLRWLALAAAVAGFAFLLMELVWYRMLAPILGGSTFTFGLILAVVLAGIGIGGLLYSHLFRGRAPTVSDLAVSTALEALAIAVPFGLGDRVAILAAVLRDLAYYGFAGHVVGWLAVTLLVVFPAAVISGVQFPLLIGLAGEGRRDVGRQVGVITAWNTLGAMAGSLAGGFGLLPLLTVPVTWLAVVVLLVAFSAVVLFLFRQLAGSRISLSFAAISALLALCMLSAEGPTAIWRHSGIGAGRANLPATTRNDFRKWKASKLRNLDMEVDGRESSVGIETAQGIAFVVNGKTDGSAIHDAPTQIMLGILPAILHPHPRKALVVGLGTGETAGWLANVESLEHVDVAELEPAMRTVAQLCSPLNHEVLSNPKVRVIDNDARETLLTLSANYDLIVSEPSNPYRAGVSSLYTREFYQAARSRLQEGGLFVQWLQGYEVDATTVRTVLATLHEVFPCVEIWNSQCEDFLLVCSVEERHYDLAQLRQRIARPEFKSAMRFVWRADDVESLLARFVAGQRFVARVARQQPVVINTDDRNLLEYGFARSVGRHGGFSSLAVWGQAAQFGDVRPAVNGKVAWDLVEDHRAQMYVVLNQQVPPATETTPEQKTRSNALRLYLQGNLAGAVSTWEHQPRDFSTHSEIALFAMVFAELNDPRAEILIERLRRFQPLEAEVVSAISLLRRGERVKAVDALERAFLGMRRDPTPHRFTMLAAFPLAIAAAGKDPVLAQRLMQALGEPFSLLYLEEGRVRTACLLAGMVGPRETTLCLEKLEPSVFWELDFLTLRAQAYQVTGHPLANRARQDLETFLGDGDDLLLP